MNFRLISNWIDLNKIVFRSKKQKPTTPNVFEVNLSIDEIIVKQTTTFVRSMTSFGHSGRIIRPTRHYHIVIEHWRPNDWRRTIQIGHNRRHGDEQTAGFRLCTTNNQMPLFSIWNLNYAFCVSNIVKWSRMCVKRISIQCTISIQRKKGKHKFDLLIFLRNVSGEKQK